nr:coproporphyrinogen III oxidase [Leptospiraceae bacterium]
ISSTKEYLRTMEEDGLISWDNRVLAIQEAGKPFLRNICMGLDLRLRTKSPETRVFSQAI